MTKKLIKGVVKKYHIKENRRDGYSPVWDTGYAAGKKRIKKITGIDRPSI